MKLKYLAAAALSLQLAACAHQPLSQNSNSSHQVYRGYEHLLGKESYAFDGRAQVVISPQKEITNKSEPKNLAQTNNEKQKILSVLFAQQKLADEQLKWMREGIDQSQVNAAKKSNSNQLPFDLEVIMGRFFYDYSGVVDLARGQMSLDSKLGYEAKNAQAWLKLPFTLDLKNDKAYADLSAFSPFLTHPQYDGRYVAFDFSKLLAASKVDKKAIFSFMREYMLVNSALAKDADYQVLKLDAHDRKLGGEKKLRYTVSYEEMTAQYMLFFYMNEQYLQNKLSATQDLQKGLLGTILTGISNPKDAVQVLENIEPKQDISHLEKTAPAARVRLETAFELAKQNIAERNQLQAEEELAAEIEAMNSDAGEDLAQAPETESLAEIFKIFEPYRSDAKPISALELKKIMDENPKAYTDFIEALKQSFKEIDLAGKPILIDLTFDTKGRIVRTETQMDFSMPTMLSQDIGLIFTADFHSYGNAKIDQTIFKNALSFEEATKESSMFSKRKVSQNQNNDQNQSSASWDESERYEALAKSLLDQKLSFIDAYATVYRYAYLLQHDIESEADFNAKELLDTARWNAIYYAEEYGFGVSKAESQEYANAPDEWPYYDDVLSEEIWEIFYDLMDQQQYKDLYKQLGAKYKNDAALFSAIYKAVDERKEQMRTGESEIEYADGFDTFVQILGEVAIEDLKTQTINQQKIAQLTEQQLDWLDTEIYEQTYQQFLK